MKKGCAGTTTTRDPSFGQNPQTKFSTTLAPSMPIGDNWILISIQYTMQSSGLETLSLKEQWPNGRDRDGLER